MNKRELKKMERYAEIIEVAKDLFTNRGLHQVQMQEIADAANLGIATLFRYFPKKEHLVIAVANTIVEEMNLHIQGIIALPISAFEKMEKIFDYYLSMVKQDFIKLIRFHESFDLYTTIATSELDDVTKFIEPREKFAKTILQLVQQGKDDGTIRQDVDSELLIMTAIQNFSVFSIKVATVRPELKQPTSYEPYKQMLLLKQIFLSFIKTV